MSFWPFFSILLPYFRPSSSTWTSSVMSESTCFSHGPRRTFLKAPIPSRLPVTHKPHSRLLNALLSVLSSATSPSPNTLITTHHISLSTGCFCVFGLYFFSWNDPHSLCLQNNRFDPPRKWSFKHISYVVPKLLFKATLSVSILYSNNTLYKALK